jgi:hypothetical protein
LAAYKGLYFHPHHNWFISNALDFNDLDQAIDLAGQVMIQLRDFEKS